MARQTRTWRHSLLGVGLRAVAFVVLIHLLVVTVGSWLRDQGASLEMRSAVIIPIVVVLCWTVGLRLVFVVRLMLGRERGDAT